MFILYPIILLFLLISSRSYFLSYLVCFIYAVMSSANKDFIFSFPMCVHLCPLQCLVGLPVDVKSESERGHPCWAPEHGGIQFPFLCYEVGCRCIMGGLSGWSSFPIFLICWELLSWRTAEFFEICFLNGYDHIFSSVASWCGITQWEIFDWWSSRRYLVIVYDYFYILLYFFC